MDPVDVQRQYARRLIENGRLVDRGWQSTRASMRTYELDDVLLRFRVPAVMAPWATQCGADMPWSETHFQERVSGQPLNPAPSYLDWPWHQGKHQEAFKTQVFDHTYPERMWPKYAGTGNQPVFAGNIHRGIRFEYGDLNDLIALLTNDPFTRQAFLPIWFPEDTGATQGQRVPCTLGYHFIRNGTELDVKYLIRSCDITRHFHNDVYMAGRLLQYVTRHSAPDSIYPSVGNISRYISNLHMFKNDEWRWK